MPLYEYQCDACGHRFEVIQKFADPPVPECPECAGPIRKLQSAPAFQLKGTGWYVTDYPKAGPVPGEKGDAAAGASASTDAEGAKSGTSEKGDKVDKGDKPEKAAAKKGEKADKGTSSKEATPSPSPTGPKAP